MAMTDKKSRLDGIKGVFRDRKVFHTGCSYSGGIYQPWHGMPHAAEILTPAKQAYITDFESGKGAVCERCRSADETSLYG